MKIYKTIKIIAIAIAISSCGTAHYQHVYEKGKALDLRQGKWLVNGIETDLSWKLPQKRE